MASGGLPAVHDGITRLCTLLGEKDMASLRSLAQTVCGDQVLEEDPDHWPAWIAQVSVRNPLGFLKRKKVRQNLLFQYLQVTAPELVVVVAAHKFPSKEELISKVLTLWGVANGGDGGGGAAEGHDGDDGEDADAGHGAAAAAHDGAHAHGGAAAADEGGGAMMRMEDVIPAQVWAQIVGLSHRDWTTDECAAGVKLQAVVQGLGKADAVSGVAGVSRWLRALSLAVVLNQTSSACEDIGHGHGYRVGFRGNVHHDESIAGMFRMNLLLAPDPAADGELRIHLVEIQMAMSAADGARQLAPLLERPHEVLALAPPS